MHDLGGESKGEQFERRTEKDMPWLWKTPQAIDPEYLVLRYGPILEVSQEMVNLAVSIIGTSKSSLMGRSPSVIAATAIYLASTMCNGVVTQKQIVDVLGIASKSIRNCLTYLQSINIVRVYPVH